MVNLLQLPEARRPATTRRWHQELPQALDYAGFHAFRVRGEGAPRRAMAALNLTLLRTVFVPLPVPQLRLPTGAGTCAGLAARLRASSGEAPLQLSAYRCGVIALFFAFLGLPAIEEAWARATGCSVHCGVPDT